ncbi:MAG: phosphodiester glycosidase family protein [Acholeplasma sp.]|nr:phosphodiester glycosidase family protein [Acholeplasma sp.]
MTTKRLLTRLTILVLGLMLFVSPIHQTQAANSFRLFANDKTTQYIDGVRHQKITGYIDYNGTISNQVINYAGVNLNSFPDIQVVVGDNYVDHGYGMSNLLAQIENVERRYDNVDVLAGVNGDFYNMSNGIPVSPYVRNYEVIFQGTTWNRTLVGFKDNGEVVIGKPEFTGYEVMVFDEDGSLKLNQINVSGFNRLPANESEVTVLFEEYTSLIDTTDQKLVVSGTDVKSDGSGARYFAKGVKDTITTDAITVSPTQFVIMGDKVFEEGFIKATDTIIVQRRLTGQFEGVRDAIGGWERLVVDGVKTETFTEGASYQYRAPRTAIGVKQDGTVFFVTVDGRNMWQGMDGVTGYEMAEIMNYFEAYQAVNLDGGGSTTMAILNETGAYDVVNTPSDGNLRTNANGVFFVKGTLEQPLPPVPFPDHRPVLNAPEHIMVSNGQLSFNPIESASSYHVYVDGVKYVTTTNQLDLDLPLGEHDIQIRAFGDHELFKQSVYSTTYQYHAYSNEMAAFLEFLTREAQAGN